MSRALQISQRQQLIKIIVIPEGGGGGGMVALRISSGGDGQMGAKIKTHKNP